ncbi:hypothetical protein [Massilia horti]|uniref:MSHA biogenesis protein MshJ n=1 Tax=Massilia horti TaxID=2562153 RepID=A0A4Y9SX00_9BURK|nr:hypothetical protein [Massilia horti]TFW30979.1 hypothetical protein E4O92_14820 [Massilia horti]
MRARLLQLAARIDALTQRERILLFATVVAVLYMAFKGAVLGPIERKQAALRTQISQQHDAIVGIDAEITQKIQAYQLDPNAPARERLSAVKEESNRLDENLRAMQKGLVAPERMGTLVGTILRANGKLRLVSMKTLPTGSLADLAADKTAAPSVEDRNAARKGADLLYRHGVEVAVRGNYLDMVDYMNALESMPTQLFWGKAQLDVEEYPTSRLTLTLYTLSLDPKWMKL